MVKGVIVKTLYIHIGWSRTGTKSIQRGLIANADTLMSQSYYIPQTGKTAESSRHFSGIRAIKQDFPPVEQFNELFREIHERPEENFIISNEGFRIMTEAQIETFRRAIPEDVQPVIIVYIRRQDKHFQSSWGQNIKTLIENISFEDFVNNHIARFSSNYDKAISLWAKFFGFDNIRLRIFEDAIKQGDVFYDFLNTCDIEDTEQFASVGLVNTTPSLKTLEIFRRLSEEYTRQELLSIPNQVRRKFCELVLTHMDSLEWNNSKLNLLAPDIRKSINARYAEPNAQLAKRYFGREQLFTDDISESPIEEFELHSDIDSEELMSLASVLTKYALHEATEVERLLVDLHQEQEINKKLLEVNQELRSDLEQTTTQVDMLNRELDARRKIPLARIGELLDAAQKERSATGWRGLIHRTWRWVNGQRRFKNQLQK